MIVVEIVAVVDLISWEVEEELSSIKIKINQDMNFIIKSISITVSPSDDFLGGGGGALFPSD